MKKASFTGLLHRDPSLIRNGSILSESCVKIEIGVPHIQIYVVCLTTAARHHRIAGVLPHGRRLAYWNIRRSVLSIPRGGVRRRWRSSWGLNVAGHYDKVRSDSVLIDAIDDGVPDIVVILGTVYPGPSLQSIS